MVGNILDLLATANTDNATTTSEVSDIATTLQGILHKEEEMTTTDFVGKVTDCLASGSSYRYSKAMEDIVLNILLKILQRFRDDPSTPFPSRSVRAMFPHVRLARADAVLPLAALMLESDHLPLAIQLAQTVSDSTEEILVRLIIHSSASPPVVRSVAMAQYDDHRLSQAISHHLDGAQAMTLLETLTGMLEDDEHTNGENERLPESVLEVNSLLKILAQLIDRHYMTFVSTSEARLLLKKLQLFAATQEKETQDLVDLKVRVEAISTVRRSIKQEQKGKSFRRRGYERSLAMPDYWIEVVRF